MLNCRWKRELMKDKNSSYNGYINIIKLFAAFVIAIHHYQMCTGLRFSYVNFTIDDPFCCGALMVEVFFVISGFMAAKYVKVIRGGQNINEYMQLRIIRILPWVIGSTMLSTIAKGLYIYLTKTIPYGKIGVWNLLIGSIGINCGLISTIYDYLPNETLWYISVLLICYLVLFINVKVSAKYQLNIEYLFGVMVIIGLAVKFYGMDLPLLNGLTARGYIAFFTGGIIYEYSLKSNMSKIVPRILLALFVVIYALAHHLFVKGLLGDNWLYFLTNQMALILVFIFMPLVLFSIKGHETRSNKLKAAKILGNISRGIYIWHLPYIYFFKSYMSVRNISNISEGLIMGYILVIGGSIITEYMFESLLNTLKQRESYYHWEKNNVDRR